MSLGSFYRAGLARKSAMIAIAYLFTGCGSDMEGSKDTGTSDSADTVDTGETTDTSTPDTPEIEETGDPDGTGVDATDTTEDTTVPEVDTTPTDTTEPDTDATDSPSFVRIVAPVEGETVRGPVVVKLEPIGVNERDVDQVTLRVNGLTVFRDEKLPTEFVLDTRQHGSPIELVAFAEKGFDSGSHRVRIAPNNPPITFQEVTPRDPWVANGSVVGLTIRVDGPSELKLTADFSALDSNYVTGAEAGYALGGNAYALTYIVSENNTRRDGTYTVPVKAKLGSWEVIYGQLQIGLRNSAESPIFVEGGIFVDQPLPLTTTGGESPSTGAPAPTLSFTNTTVLTGASTTIRVDWSNQENLSDIVGVIIGLEGTTGYYQVPLDSVRFPNRVGIEQLLRLKTFADYEVPPTSLPVRVAVRDSRGRVTNYASQTLTVDKVGSGDIQVSLSWDKTNDLDLYVVDPFGCTIYWVHKNDNPPPAQCRGLGALQDRDANIGCSGPRNENIFWPPGVAPEGQYSVMVNNYNACSNATVNYTVTVNYCGKTETYEGRFTGAATPSSDPNPPGAQVVARFSNVNCSRVATGRIRYQDRTFDRNGFGGLQWKTLEGVVVELRRLQSGEVIGTGVTDRNGNYRIPFPEVPGFIVAVKAQTDPNEGLRDIKIFDHPKFNRLYEVTTPPVILYPNQEVVVQDVDIAIDAKAGAFNILDVMRKGYDLVRLNTGRELGLLRGFWATGTDTTDTIFCSQFLYDYGECTELNSVSVQGKDTDRDEFDDMVILKEFFKFALDILSRDSHPGGTVNGLRSDSRRAWTEGAAHFFASDVLGSRHYVNSRPFGVYIVDDLEGMPTPFAFSKRGPDVSHYLIAAVLWDLADSANEENDPVDRMRSAVYDSIFTYLPSDNYVDRGEEGVDLTDFLDGWFCRGWDEESDVEKLVVDHYDFPYDFDGPEGCYSNE